MKTMRMKTLEALRTVALKNKLVEFDGGKVTVRALTFGENMLVTKLSRVEKVGPEGEPVYGPNGEAVSDIDGNIIMEETLLRALLDDKFAPLFEDESSGREVIQNLPCSLAVELMRACAVLNGTSSVEEEAGNSEAPRNGSAPTGSRGSSESSSTKSRRRRSRKS